MTIIKKKKKKTNVIYLKIYVTILQLRIGLKWIGTSWNNFVLFFFRSFLFCLFLSVFCFVFIGNLWNSIKCESVYKGDLNLKTGVFPRFQLLFLSPLQKSYASRGMKTRFEFKETAAFV